MPVSHLRPPLIRNKAARIAFWYALFAVAWIALSDSALYRLWPEPDNQVPITLAKGSAFVVATALLLFCLMRRAELGQQARSASALQTTAQILDASPTALFRWRPEADWPVEFASANVRRWGYEPDDFLSGRRRFADIIHAEDVARVTSDLIRLARDRQAEFAHSYRVLAADGTPIWLDGRTSVIRDASGRVVCYQGTVTDVTDRVRAEQELRASERRFHAFMAEAPAMATIKDTEGRYLYVNAAWERAHGVAQEHATGKTVYDVMPEELARAFDIRHREVIETGRSIEATDEAIDRHGVRHVWRTVRFPFEGNGSQHLIGSIAIDVTALEDAETKLREHAARLERAMISTVDIVSNMVEMRDPYTAGHERRVGELAAAIAAEMGLDDHIQKTLRIAGALHDVGKIAVPTDILSKPGRLNSAEISLVRTHAEHGYALLKRMDFPWPLADVAHQHHERLDGSGYPQGLKGDEIALEARITAVADVVEAMSSHRPYRPSLGIEPALEEIERNKGRYYDVAAVDACLRLFREKGYKIG